MKTENWQNVLFANKCVYDGCQNTEILSSNARYCPICGEKSAFYNNNLLNSWDYNNAESPDAFMNIPDDIDEELPFNWALAMETIAF